MNLGYSSSPTEDETDSEATNSRFRILFENGRETRLALRMVYVSLYFVAFWLFWKPKSALKLLGDGPSRDVTLVRALALAVVALALQHTAAVQGQHDARKRSLQYGMFSWLSYAAFTVYIQHMMGASFKFAPCLVAVDLFFFGVSLAACYYL